MDTRRRAEELAGGPYLIMTSLEETTQGKPIYLARVLEMDGCFGQGGTPEQAIVDLRAAMVDFIESLLEDGLPVPEPTKPAPTLGTSTHGVFTFTAPKGKKLQKQSEHNQGDYILRVKTG